jgi:lysine 2,3-aminomutase
MNLKKKQESIKKKIHQKSTFDVWHDWKWQVKHCITDIDTVEKLLDVRFDPLKKKELEETLERFPLSLTPYYLSLIDSRNIYTDPIFIQSVPSGKELLYDKADMQDPLAEDKDSPVPGLTHRYPDRVLMSVSNVCAMYCRHCTRKRRVGDNDYVLNKKNILAQIKYVKAHKNIRDVLLSGGDPLMLSDEYLDWILGKIRAIEHVEIIRIGSRIPVVLPYRVTDSLVDVLKKYHPLWLNTQFNHPREMSVSSQKALAKLANAGIPLGNQTVLLAGVNDCPRIMKALVHALLKNRVRPYYLYQCDLSEGLGHFRTPVGKGIEIIENLIGHTSGMGVPTYVIDAPGGGGKIPVMPNYLISWSTNKVILRNYEGVITTYKEPDSYEPVFCDRNCEKCKLQLPLASAEEEKAVGICQLFSDEDATISLTPSSNTRLKKRNKKS